jgi:ubiquinone/menaquinone biosynthesis methyltransferase
MDNRKIYSPSFVKALFDEMSRTYGVVNLVSSFGFCSIWRRQCVSELSFSAGATICDLMSGMGECWRSIKNRSRSHVSIVAVDFSPKMCRQAELRKGRYSGLTVKVILEDVFGNSIADNSSDHVISTFGLKTFSEEQQRRFATEIERVLKPDGDFSLLEISVPPSRLLKSAYMFYIKRVVPLIGRTFLGNPDNYRMLGVYTERFENCEQMYEAMRDAGLTVEYRSYFFGCATGIVGSKPSAARPSDDAAEPAAKHRAS